MGFLLLLVKNFFLPSNLTPFLFSFLSILAVLLTMRARLATSISSSLELSCSTFDLPLFSWLALKAKSFLLVEEEPSYGVMCMYISCALIFPNIWVGVAVERSPWWSTITICPYLSMGRTLKIFLTISDGCIRVSPSPWPPLQEYSSVNTFH